MRKRVGANTLKKRAETRSPAALRKAAKKGFSAVRFMVISALVCTAAAAGARGLWQWVATAPQFVVREIEVHGAVRVDSKEIIRLSAIREGIRMFSVKPSEAVSSILTNCWIRGAKVSRRFPHTIVITVEERSPIALVNVGGIYYLDAEGALMPLFAATYSDLPLISGMTMRRPDSAGKRIAAVDVKRVSAFFQHADSISKTILKHVSQIDFSSQAMATVTLDNSRMLVEIDDRKGSVQWGRFQELMGIMENTPEGMPQRINLCFSNLGFAQW